jgi:hypothetical protein
MRPPAAGILRSKETVKVCHQLISNAVEICGDDTKRHGAPKVHQPLDPRDGGSLG